MFTQKTWLGLPRKLTFKNCTLVQIRKNSVVIRNTYRIDANTTADSIIMAPRVNSNTKAPKYLNLNNITAS